jgi:hypothetical protein
MQGYLIAVPDRHLAAFGVGQVVDSQPGRHAAVLYMAWSGQVQRTFVSSMAAKLADKCVAPFKNRIAGRHASSKLTPKIYVMMDE